MPTMGISSICRAWATTFKGNLQKYSYLSLIQKSTLLTQLLYSRFLEIKIFQEPVQKLEEPMGPDLV
jgi:hypothetical protein